MLPTTPGIYRMTSSNGNVHIMHCSNNYYSDQMSYWAIAPVTFEAMDGIGSSNAKDFIRKYSPVKFDELFLHDENGLCGSLHTPIVATDDSNAALAS